MKWIRRWDMTQKRNSHLTLISCLLVLTLTTSCLSSTGFKCQEIDISEQYYLDSISSGLEMNDGIYSASIRLQGFVENDIQFNRIPISAGAIDTLINNQDQYGTQFIYEIFNESEAQVKLEICISFSH